MNPSDRHGYVTRIFIRLVVATATHFALPGPVQAGDSLGFKVAAGFQVERVAADGVLRFPMFATLDDQGRLYVCESSGLDLYAELSAGTRRCRISRLEDRDGDGRFESSVVFADRLVFPMGIAWRNGLLYVADPPDLVTLGDTDGDGRADERKVILTGFGHQDNGSLHGLVFGPDGLLTMTMGMPDGYRLARGDGTWLEGNSGAWIRCRPDGSRPQVVSRGFVNLVEVAFLPDGEAIGTDNWFQEPAGGIRDALVHLVDGGLYPYVPDSGTPQPVTGPPLPALSVYPAVALSGLARLEGPSLPASYQGNLVSAQHNTRSVGRHVLIPQGATFRSEDSVLLNATDPDFHPADVLVDGDGSILVLDTGAWYVQHCPTGRIRAADSRGGVYRLRWSDAERVADPFGRAIDLTSMSPEQLTASLNDRRPAVRARIRRELAARGKIALGALTQALSKTVEASVRLEVVWTLSEINDPVVSPLLRQSLMDSHPDVASAATRVMAAREDESFALDLVRSLRTGSAWLKRVAAEALAHCGDRSAATGTLVRDRERVRSAPEAFARVRDPSPRHRGGSESRTGATRATNPGGRADAPRSTTQTARRSSAARIDSPHRFE